MDKNSFQIRATGVLIEDEKILLVKQNISSTRNWSLPGGRVEAGELLNEAVIREVFEETGLVVSVHKLLYLCDKPDSNPPIIHITFLLKRISGEIVLPSNEFDENPISDVRFIPLSDIELYGFSKKFKELAFGQFENAGNYMGIKSNVGLH